MEDVRSWSLLGRKDGLMRAVIYLSKDDPSFNDCGIIARAKKVDYRAGLP